MRAATILIAIAVAAVSSSTAAARTSRHGNGGGGGVPALDVRGSCMDAQKFSSGIDKNVAFKGCMQDEMAAKDTLNKRWTSYKTKDRSDCVEQARNPSPSYVEVLTCLEMDTDAMNNAPKANDKPVSQVGGAVAPGLGTSPVPSSPAPQ